MIKMQDQTSEQKKNKFVKQQEKIQQAKKVGVTALGLIATVGITGAKYGKQIIANAPKAGKVAVDVVKTIVKL